MRRSLAAGVVVLALATAGCGGGSTVRAPRTLTPPPPTAVGATPTTSAAAPSTAPTADVPCGTTAASPPARYDHVVWIWMENKSFNEVLRSSNAPFERELAGKCATAARYSDVGSPSLPNYIGATSGSTQGIGDDDSPTAHMLDVDNLFRQVRAAGMTERSYEESMPRNCALSSSGDYAVKHNPGAYYSGEGDRSACEADNVALGTLTGGALATDLDGGTLPAFSFITPNLCNDTHDCAVRTGDEWLEQWLPRILSNTVYASGKTAVFVVWDESTPMPFIAVSPTTRPGTVVSTAVDHYSLLRTTEEMLGIQTFLGKAASAPSMRGELGL